MYYSYFNMIFILTLVFGSFLSISSSFWFSAWAGLELNLISFIPLIISSKSKYSSEAALKYFLIQALGSSMIIFSSSLLLFSNFIFSILLSLSLLLKLGAAPFHFWFPQVMEGMMWPQAIMLMTIQKMAPLFLLSYMALLINNSIVIYLSSMFSAIIGAIGGLNQISLRKILSFSSINHLAWMLSTLMISENIFFTYFILYCFISSSIALVFFSGQFFFFNQLTNSKLPNLLKILSIMSILSLGGLPPFTGFIPKWLIIQELAAMNSFVLLAVLISSALLTLYYYLRLSFSIFVISSSKIKPLLLKKTVFKYESFLYMNFLGLLIPSCLVLI
uniref:NADH-ubiquinone oxidoreductase chain 2 n=1 Tax=Neopetrolisthes maculatus TaxID=941218 RepID=L0E8X8_9EUCA|nr:NADH dehydrogenase subunit 2 [Neopetrolisthes maculatus]AGA56145.1 NADH dehydrogenase subunit 2 [Neopetrolisthes maculatus]